MSLAAFQIALGRTVRARTVVSLDGLELSEMERERVTKLLSSDGFRATMAVQRSWCESRAALGASLTLSMLPAQQRRELTAEWITQGGGTNSFFAAEADAFLDFIGKQLPSPSHALRMCQLERAVLRAEEQAAQFVSPDIACLRDPDCVLSRSDHAALVALFTQPEELLGAIENGQELPELSEEEYLLFVAPGLSDRVRSASSAEVALWDAVTAPKIIRGLLDSGHQQITIERLVSSGILQTGKLLRIIGNNEN